MLTLEDIVNVSFVKAGFSAGYRAEDVDDFIDEVKESYEEIVHKYNEQREATDELKKENASLLEKLDVLVECVEKYRSEENDLKNVLVGAHKTADITVKDAKIKAEAMLEEAKAKSDNMVYLATVKSEEIKKETEAKASEIIESAKKEADFAISSVQSKIVENEKLLEEIELEVSNFRTNLIETYRKHITLIQNLPSKEEPYIKTPEQEKEEVSKEVEPETAVPKEAVFKETVAEKPKEEVVSEKAPKRASYQEEIVAGPAIIVSEEIKPEVEETDNRSFSFTASQEPKDAIEIPEAEIAEPFTQQRFMTQAVPDLSAFKPNVQTYDFDEYDFEEEEEDEEPLKFFGLGRKKKK